MSDEIRTQSAYWGKEADAFNRIYSHKKSPVSNILDRWFRKDMYQRFAFTLEHCEPVANRRFLDVGCGSGVYSIALAQKGAAQVTGLDIAEPMIALCNSSAQTAGVADRCTFIPSDLLAFTAEERFHVTIGIGLFDYIADPLPVLAKMNAVSTDAVVVCFPRLLTWRAPVRKVRLMMRGCPVFFFTRRRVEQLMRDAGFKRHEISRVGKLHCVVGYPA
jgi:2-polyprenyl-3-methyl-5-hydroxy-6-metoxy-1,4-benzoquinol methylase